MDEVVVPTAEELAAEQAGLKVPTEVEIRAEVIKEYGFDETEDAERIEKLSKKQFEQRKMTSSAIAAKIKQRERAEALSKQIPPKQKTDDDAGKKEATLSSEDVFTLVDAKVPKDDIKDVQEYAKLRGITIAAALESSVVKTILADKAEKRRSAHAASTGDDTGAGGSGTVSTAKLLENASKGVMPESDADIKRLAQARIAQKKALTGKK